MRFFCIGDERTVRGFRLAGVAGRVASSPDAAEQALREACADASVAVILVTDSVAASVPQAVEAIRQKRPGPVVLSIPGPEGPTAGAKSLRELVRSAVGASVEEETR